METPPWSLAPRLFQAVHKRRQTEELDVEIGNKGETASDPFRPEMSFADSTSSGIPKRKDPPSGPLWVLDDR